MQSYIIHYGYGYSKRLCEDVSIWFLKRFFPRHKISIEIFHRGLKREKTYGYCDVVGKNSYPREFLIELDTYMNKELYIKTLLHELIHVKQWIKGYLKFENGKMYYNKEPVENYDYLNQPHEIDARKQELKLYNEYYKDKDMPIQKVAHFFPNRLTQRL